MPREGQIRQCPHEELDTAQHCPGIQRFSKAHRPPVGWSIDQSSEMCSGWICDLNREHFNCTMPTGEEVLY